MVQVKAIGEKLERPIYVRVKFAKMGKLQYISHLDLVRTMHKILIRSKMPLWFSEGFNPKPKMIFASSMSVGLQSECEFMDVRVTHRLDLDSAIEALSSTSPDELTILDVYYPTTEFTEIGWAEYKMSISSKDTPEGLPKRCKELLKSSPLVVLKRTKSGDKDVDISSYIGDVDASASDDGDVELRVMLRAENTSFLNPEYLVTAMKNSLGILSGNLLENTYEIVRTAMYDADMNLFR